MFSKIGSGELLVIVLIALVVLGPAKLLQTAKSLGKAVGYTKKYMSDIKEEIDEVQLELEEVETTVKQPVGSKHKDEKSKEVASTEASASKENEQFENDTEASGEIPPVDKAADAGAEPSAATAQ